MFYLRMSYGVMATAVASRRSNLYILIFDRPGFETTFLVFDLFKKNQKGVGEDGHGMSRHSLAIWRECRNLYIFTEPSYPENAPLSLYF